MFTLLQSDLVSLDDDNWVKSSSGNQAAELAAIETHHTTKYLTFKLKSDSTKLNTIRVSSFYAYLY